MAGKSRQGEPEAVGHITATVGKQWAMGAAAAQAFLHTVQDASPLNDATHSEYIFPPHDGQDNLWQTLTISQVSLGFGQVNNTKHLRVYIKNQLQKWPKRKKEKIEQRY